ncbi:hypothetical protein CKA32_000919 [Geitlerinema sp. FC II]|nr:hypothetical protein CKA32_000919 [Geitlerinema sp. FC II]
MKKYAIDRELIEIPKVQYPSARQPSPQLPFGRSASSDVRRVQTSR